MHICNTHNVYVIYICNTYKIGIITTEHFTYVFLHNLYVYVLHICWIYTRICVYSTMIYVLRISKEYTERTYISYGKNTWYIHIYMRAIVHEHYYLLYLDNI